MASQTTTEVARRREARVGSAALRLDKPGMLEENQIPVIPDLIHCYRWIGLITRYQDHLQTLPSCGNPRQPRRRSQEGPRHQPLQRQTLE